MAVKDKDREQRLAAALRDNLRRRKAQTAAATNSDAEARLERGLDLLGKAQSLADLSSAVELIEAASAAGLARATEQCALLECVGVGRPVNWTRALDRLEQAAEQGSASAAGQLLLFADPEMGGVAPSSAAAGFWTKVRQSIDDKALLGARDALTALERPFVGVMQKFAGAAECRWLIDSARSRLGPSTVFDQSSGALRPDPLRSGRAAMFPFDQIDLVVEVIRARIAATLDMPLRQFEVSQVLHYAPGQEFHPHHDYFDPSVEGFHEEIAARGQRVATLLIFLNDDFTGGETRFPSLGFDYRGGVGDAIAFASVDPDGRPNPLTLHAGLPPTSGEKWIFSQWIRDRAPGLAARPIAR